MRRIALAAGAAGAAARPPPRRRRTASTPRSGGPRTACRTSRRRTSPASATATATRWREDNLCTIAEQYVTVRAERSRFFGPDATYTWRANSSVNRNLESDFTFKRIIDTRVVEGLIAKAPPNGPRPEVREAVRGYTAGYNRYLRETGVANLPDPACRGAAWVRPIEEIDVYRRFYQLALLASTGVALDGVGGAQPPTPALPAPPLPAAGDFDALADRLPLGGIGSNAYGLGRRQDVDRQGHAARQPALPVGRRRALLPGAPHDPRADRRLRREPARRAGRADRPHARARVEPHGLDRVPLHAVRAHARARLADHLPRRRAAAADDRPRGDRAGAPARRQPRAAHAHALLDALRARLHLAARAAAVPVDAAPRRSRSATPTPATSATSTTSSRRTSPRARASTTRCCAATRASRGSTRSAPTRAARPTTPTSRSSRTSPTRTRRPATPRSAQTTFTALRPAGARRRPLGLRLGPRRRRAAARHVRPGQAAVAVPPRLRDELQRLVLAQQPGAAADRLQPHHRRREHGALAAHADRADHGRAAGGSRSRSCRRRCSTTASTRASCGATLRWRCAARPALGEPCDVLAPRGTCATTTTRAARSCSGASPSACSRCPGGGVQRAVLVR